MAWGLVKLGQMQCPEDVASDVRSAVYLQPLCG